jgi:alkylated DNA repair dioxygenase AlkB
MSSIETNPEASVMSGFLAPDVATILFDSLLVQIEWDERMKARKTACFGQTYDDSGVDYQVVPMHPLLEPLCDTIERAVGFRPTNCLLNYYDSGRSTMGFHSDATYNLAEGTGVAIVSLGAERNLTFRSKHDQSLIFHFPLPHGSLFYMTQETQRLWTHAVKKTDTDDARISLTFRHIITPEELARRQDDVYKENDGELGADGKASPAIA